MKNALVPLGLLAGLAAVVPASGQSLDQIARQCREEAMTRRGYPKDTPSNSRTANVGRGFTGEVDQCISDRSRNGPKPKRG